MPLILCLVSFLLSSMLSTSVLGKPAADASTQQKVHALVNAVQKAGCQQYLARNYRYEHMYDIAGVAFDNTVVRKENDDLKYFEMHIAIKTVKDGIILLSPTRNPGRDDLVFEFAVGIEYGVMTLLRLRKEGLINRDEVARVRTPKIISPTEYTKFYIIIDNDVLTFGKEGEAPIISYPDERLKTIKYFDISSYGNLEAKFLYDCPAPTSL